MNVLNQQPDGIIVTWGQSMLTAGHGNLDAFRRIFEREMRAADGCWLQKCRNKPKHDVLFVYIIVANLVEYRANYAGYETGPMEGMRPNGERVLVTWPRILLTGPMEKAPFEIPMRGFQGFRYTHKLF